MGETVFRKIIEQWYSSRKFMISEREGKTLPEFLDFDPFTKSMDPCALTKHITFDVLLEGGSDD